jgi:hypothetical protein
MVALKQMQSTDSVQQQPSQADYGIRQQIEVLSEEQSCIEAYDQFVAATASVVTVFEADPRELSRLRENVEIKCRNYPSIIDGIRNP